MRIRFSDKKNRDVLNDCKVILKIKKDKLQQSMLKCFENIFISKLYVNETQISKDITPELNFTVSIDAVHVRIKSTTSDIIKCFPDNLCFISNLKYIRVDQT